LDGAANCNSNAVQSRVINHHNETVTPGAMANQRATIVTVTIVSFALTFYTDV